MYLTRCVPNRFLKPKKNTQKTLISFLYLFDLTLLCSKTEVLTRTAFLSSHFLTVFLLFFSIKIEIGMEWSWPEQDDRQRSTEDRNCKVNLQTKPKTSPEVTHSVDQRPFVGQTHPIPQNCFHDWLWLDKKLNTQRRILFLLLYFRFNLSPPSPLNVNLNVT
jgi:hypothetical protein